MVILPGGEATRDHGLIKKIRNGIQEVSMTEDTKIADEMKKMEHEPLLPAEKKLIGYSLALGIILLGILVWINYAFFSVQ